MKLLHLKVVLAAIDANERSVDTLRAARELATAAGAKLHVIHATAAGADGAAARRLFERGELESSASLEIVAGEPTHVVRSFADRISADVIVLGQHRARGAEPRSLGSTALGVVTNSWAPCLVVSRPLRLPLEQVVVPVDLSDTSRGALVVGLAWASALRKHERGSGGASGETAHLTALFVGGGAARGTSPRALEDELARLRRDAGTWAGVSIRGEVVAGDKVPQAIAQFAGEHHSDLIVLGTRGLGSDAVGRLGSVALGVLRGIDQPILLVPPAVWESYSSRE